MAGWLPGTGLAITGKLGKQGKLRPFVIGNVHFRLAGGLSPPSADHDSRVGRDNIIIQYIYTIYYNIYAKD